MRRLLIIVGSLITILVLIIALIPVFVNANDFKRRVQAQLSQSLGRAVTIGDLGFNLFSGTVTAKDLSIADDPRFSRSPFVTAKSLALSIEVMPAILQHKWNVKGIDIDTPQVALIQAPSGLWNYSSMSASSQPQRQAAPSSDEKLALIVKTLRVANGRVSVQQSGQTLVLNGVRVSIDDFAPGAVFPFSLTGQVAGGGDVNASGKAGPINNTDASETPLTANIKLTNLNLAASGTAPRGSGIDGIVSVNANTNSDGRNLHLMANVQAARLKLAAGGTPARNPLQINADAQENLKTHAGQLSRGDVNIGGVKAALTGVWNEQNNATEVKMNLAATNVPIPAIEDLLPALDIRLPAGSTLEGGTASAMLAIDGPTSAMIVSGPVSAHNTRLKGFDLGTKLGPIERLAGINSGPNTDIQTLSAVVRATPEGTALSDINLVIPALGQLTGAGTVNAAHVLNFKMLADVRAANLIGTRAAAKIPFSIEGTSSDPQFKPDVGQIASEELNRQLKGVKVGGVDVGSVAGGVLGGLFGGKKKK